MGNLYERPVAAREHEMAVWDFTRDERLNAAKYLRRRRFAEFMSRVAGWLGL